MMASAIYSNVINTLHSRILKTFEEYAVLEVVPKIPEYSCTYTRTDFVFDMYTDWSSKHDQSDVLALNTE
jgi:hypothetical protein